MEIMGKREAFVIIFRICINVQCRIAAVVEGTVKFACVTGTRTDNVARE